MTDREGRVSLRLHLEPSGPAASEVRTALRHALAGTPFEVRLPDAELAATELVTNAVLHGREPIDVVVQVEDDALRIAVTDASPVSPSFSLLDPTALTGRGMLLVAACSDRWGVDPHDSGKTVWVELMQEKPSADERAEVAALLDSWGEDLEQDPASERVRVVLTDLDTALMVESEAYVDGLLRELALVVHGGSRSPEVTGEASRVLTAVAAFEAVRNELKRQLALAVTHRQPAVDVELRITRGDAELVRDYNTALEAAYRLCAREDLLLAPQGAKAADVGRSYLRRILAQLGS